MLKKARGLFLILVEIFLILNVLVQYDSTNTKALYLRGTAFSKKRQYANAIRDLTAAIDNDPNHIEAFYDRGDLS